ncbi:MAG: hypothetical protein GKR93_17260 [Gammaproteobacteria bacterium]|nr:hypothetical protein [Gammaproteobacteria bacterium]
MSINFLNFGRVFFLAAILLSIWAYYPGLGGGFIFDDVGNISENQHLKVESFSASDLWQASLSSHSGPLKRPISMFSFALNHIFTGMDPWWMKLTNLLIHLFNSLLLLLFCKQFFRRIAEITRLDTKYLPSIVAGIWLIHPINITSVSYIVQRMTSLSSTFVLLALYIYLKLRNEKPKAGKAYFLGAVMLGSWSLGILSKESALSFSIFLFAMEWLLYRFQSESASQKRFLTITWVLVALPWIVGLCYVAYKPSFLLGAYAYRDFTLSERLLTESRIVVDYMRLILVPDIRDMGLYNDDIILSTSMLSPPKTILAILTIFVLLVSAFRLRRKNVLFSLGIFWFFGGHILESTVHPLELMFIHRNYLPCLGIFMTLVGPSLLIIKEYRKILLGILLLVFTGYSFSTRLLSHHYSGDYSAMILEAMNHPKSVRANFSAGQVFKLYAMNIPAGKHRDENRKMALKHFKAIRALDSQAVTGEMGVLETYVQIGEAPPEGLIDELVTILPAGKIDISMVNIFKNYTACLDTENCVISHEELERIKDALLRNPEMEGYFKRSLLINYAKYLAETRENIDLAITTLLESTMAHPMLEDYMLLSTYYERGGYREQVIRTLDLLELQDQLGMFKKQITDTRSRMLNLN